MHQFEIGFSYSNNDAPHTNCFSPIILLYFNKISTSKGYHLPLQTLHTLAVDELAISNPTLYSEYLNLVNELIELIRNLVEQNPNLASFSCLTEKYDTNSNQAYLDLVINDQISRLQIHIYLHKDLKQFIIGLDGMGKSTRSSSESLNVIEEEIKKYKWV